MTVRNLLDLNGRGHRNRIIIVIDEVVVARVACSRRIGTRPCGSVVLEDLPVRDNAMIETDTWSVHSDDDGIIYYVAMIAGAVRCQGKRGKTH